MKMEFRCSRSATTAGVFFAVATLVIAAISGCRIANSASFGETKRIKRGEYLVKIGGCNDCHTPFTMGPNGPEPDTARLLSGHPAEMKMPPAPALSSPWMWAGAATNTAFAGPWGVTYAANLTPDENTGMKVWTEAMFVSAMRTGKHMGVSRPIMPPMPWQAVAAMTDADLKAVYAYLQSIPPIKNDVPLYAPPGASQQ